MIGSLKALEDLNLSSNPKLAGRAPREIGLQLRKLKRLDLSHTGLVRCGTWQLFETKFGTKCYQLH